MAGDDLDERLQRIHARLAELKLVSADARDEILTATEQLLDVARAELRDARRASS